MEFRLDSAQVELQQTVARFCADRFPLAAVVEREGAATDRASHVTDVDDADDHPEVAAVVITDTPVDTVAAALRERLSAFKVPTRWLLTPDPAVVPMSATGKVDKPGLQRLLGELGRPAHVKERTE
jgi:hypothetical protein